MDRTEYIKRWTSEDGQKWFYLIRIDHIAPSGENPIWVRSRGHFLKLFSWNGSPDETPRQLKFEDPQEGQLWVSAHERGITRIGQESYACLNELEIGRRGEQARVKIMVAFSWSGAEIIDVVVKEV